MAYMRSTIAYGLFWINLIIISLVYFFAVNIFSNSDYYYSHGNLRGTREKEKLLLQENTLNPLYKLQPEQKQENKNQLRNLYVDKDYKFYIIYVNSASVFFLMILMFSFCLTENECCTSDTNANRDFALGSCYGTCVCCTDCNCKGGDCKCDGGGDAGLGLLVILICILAFVAIYFILKGCGKHIARICAVGFLGVLDIAILVLSIMIGNSYYGFNTYSSMTVVVTLIGAICNILGLVLPNLGNCQKLRYGYMYVDNPAQNNYPVQDINMPMVTTTPVVQPVVQAPIVQPMTPIYDQNQVPNTGYDTNPVNIYGVAPPVQYQPPPPQNNNYYNPDNNYNNNYYNNEQNNNNPYPTEQQVYDVNQKPQ